MKAWFVLCCMAVALVGCSSPSSPETQGKATGSGNMVLDLRISPDGTAIVDAEGNPIAHFVEGMKVSLAAGNKSTAASIPGCMCCKDECISYDSNGKCTKTYRSCTWDFDCSCK